VISSLSVESQPAMKKSEAYRRYTILVSRGMCELAELLPLPDPLTFVLEEVAHARAAGEDELRDVFDNLGLVFGGEGGEPLGQALRASARD
jgi:hypothetical protein